VIEYVARTMSTWSLMRTCSRVDEVTWAKVYLLESPRMYRVTSCAMPASKPRSFPSTSFRREKRLEVWVAPRRSTPAFLMPAAQALAATVASSATGPLATGVKRRGVDRFPCAT
jgi:hypothetical protein